MAPASAIPVRLEWNNLAPRHTEPSAGLTQLLWSPLQQHLDKQRWWLLALHSLSKLRAVCSEEAGGCQQPRAVPQAGFVCSSQPCRAPPWGETPCGTCGVCSYAKH